MPIDWVWAVLKIFAQKIEDLQKSDFVVWLICGMFGNDVSDDIEN